MAIFVFSEIFIKIRMYQASETGSTLRITYYTAEFSMSNFSVNNFWTRPDGSGEPAGPNAHQL